MDYVDAHHDPLDIVLALAQRYGTVLLNGSGFDGPPWSARVSLANLDADDYVDDRPRPARRSRATRGGAVKQPKRTARAK